MTATRLAASTLGVLVGLAGVDHGIFEMLQGDTPPTSLMIAAIGPRQRFWEHGTEWAITILPSLLWTGILAVIVGLAVAAWAAFFVQTRRGPLVLMLLALLLFLVGGGFAPIFMAVLASLTATQIHHPLPRARRLLTPRGWRALARLWPWSLVGFVLAFILSVEVAILGWPLTAFLTADQALAQLNTLAYLMLALMGAAILSGMAFDITQEAEGSDILQPLTAA